VSVAVRQPVRSPRVAEPDFRALFESAPDRYLVLDPAFTIVAVTDAYAAVTMTKREEILGRLIFEVFPDNPGDPDADGVRNLRASLERVRTLLVPDTMALQKYDVRRPASEGGDFEERYWGPVNSPVLDSRGELAWIIHRVEDVTAMVRARAGAREANDLVETVVENIPNMVFVKDAERLSFVRLNRAGEALLGLPRTELIGKTDYDFFPREQAEFFQAKDRETLTKKGLVEIVEEPLETAHGKRLLRTKKVPILDASGAPQYLLGISEDITELRAHEEATKRHQQELVRAKEAADAANRELESFSYSVAHDLRAPLRSIDGFSQALLEDCGPLLDDDSRRHLGFVREAAQLMAVLIDDILALSRVTRQEIDRRAVDLSALARASMRRIERGAPERAVEVSIEDDLQAYGDPRLLSVVLDNLLGNAWKFTAKRADAKIELGATSKDGQTVYFVRDNGAGYDMKYEAKLFGVFQRLHAAHEFEGTGVGLATVQRVVHRHGGRVWAEGKVGEGAVFYFTLAPEERG
jgi:PAS domain S-box-containing protein